MAEAPAVDHGRRGFQLEDASEYTGMSVSWLRKKIYSGEIPARKLGMRTIILREDLDRMLEEAPRA